MNLTVLVKGGFLIDQTAENILRHSHFRFQPTRIAVFSYFLWCSMVVFADGDSGWLW